MVNPSASDSQSSLTPLYDWYTVQTPSHDSEPFDAINCPSSTGSKVYLMSGIKLYLTKRSPTGPEIIQGMKVYCSRLNRVKVN